MGRLRKDKLQEPAATEGSAILRLSGGLFGTSAGLSGTFTIAKTHPGRVVQVEASRPVGNWFGGASLAWFVIPADLIEDRGSTVEIRQHVRLDIRGDMTRFRLWQETEGAEK